VSPSEQATSAVATQVASAKFKRVEYFFFMGFLPPFSLSINKSSPPFR